MELGLKESLDSFPEYMIKEYEDGASVTIMASPVAQQ